MKPNSKGLMSEEKCVFRTIESVVATILQSCLGKKTDASSPTGTTISSLKLIFSENWDKLDEIKELFYYLIALLFIYNFSTTTGSLFCFNLNPFITPLVRWSISPSV